MRDALFSPFTGAVGLTLTVWLLTFGGIAVRRRQRLSAAGFLAMGVVMAVASWTLLNDTKAWRQHSAELPVREYYIVLGAVFLGLAMMLVYYAIARFDSELVDPSGATWMLPATGAAFLATGSLLLDVATLHIEAQTLTSLLAIICAALALSLVCLTGINGAQAWGKRKHNPTTE